MSQRWPRHQSALIFYGYRVLTVGDGAAALDRVRAEPGVLPVLSDHNMPGVAIALVKALRAGAYPGRIVILSGYLRAERGANTKCLASDQILSRRSSRFGFVSRWTGRAPADHRAPQLVQQ